MKNLFKHDNSCTDHDDDYLLLRIYKNPILVSYFAADNYPLLYYLDRQKPKIVKEWQETE